MKLQLNFLGILQYSKVENRKKIDANSFVAKKGCVTSIFK